MVKINNNMSKNEIIEELRKEIIKITNLEKTNRVSSTLNNGLIVINNQKYKIIDILKKITNFLDGKENVKNTERLYCLYYNINSPPVCKYCQKNYVKFINLNYGYRKYCCVSCFNKSNEKKEKNKKSCIERYGVENPFQAKEVKEKIKKTNLEKYGVEHNSYLEDTIERRKKTREQNKLMGKRFNYTPPSNIEEKIRKAKSTCIERYGVENPFQAKEVKEKIKKTNLEKYGVEHNTQNKKILEKSKNTKYRSALNNLEKRVGKKYKLLSEDYKGAKKHKYLWECLDCGSQFYYNVANGKSPRCPKCYPYTRSISEQEIFEFLNDNCDWPITYNSKSIISPYELDIFIPKLNFAVEFNGLYWHSEIREKGKYYHLNKTKKCLENNVKLFQIFEDEWILKKEIIKSMLLYQLGKTPKKIYARKCRVSQVKNSISAEFLEKNHIQGNINSKYSFGLYYKGKLVSILTIGKPRYNKNYQFEIHRFCNLINCSVVGGFSKLLKYAIKKLNIKNIITYADLRFGSGQVYKKFGFQFKGTSQPNYYYVKNPFQERKSRVQFQKHKLKDKLEYFDPNLTERENMELNNYTRIWDCGNAVYTLESTDF